MKKYVCLDIGGTSIKYGVIGEDGIFGEKGTKAAEAAKGGLAILKNAIAIIENLQYRSELCGICVSTAGVVDPERGEIIFAGPTIPDYSGLKLKETLEKHFGLPCEVENDVNCAHLAEYVSGVCYGTDISVMLTVGTGIGGSIIIDGKIYRGSSGFAFEVGYMNMGNSDFQSLGSASALTSKVSERKRESKEKWNGLRIFKEAQNGDFICCQAVNEMVNVLGRGIANLCYVVNPEILVLGGGIMQQTAYLSDRIEKAVKNFLLPPFAERTKILYAKHGNDAGIIGAYYNFHRVRKVDERK